MNNDIIISVKNLTKTYKLYDNHTDRVKETFHPFRKKYHRKFNALNNVNLEITRGETVGIIGRNGSGKSTLLQIICGILQPTLGTVEVNGRVSALLELGTGFNLEFSGIHNIYINGSILGLNKQEIDTRFDDILSFADIGDFIYQPVKTYSSGMVMRLAFAVAVSINPDILIVDEALSVGDEAFQRKCFSRLKNLQERGGTILFVSHGTGIIVELCNRSFLIDQGELLLGGYPKIVISRYHEMIFAPLKDVENIKKKWRLDGKRFNLDDYDLDVAGTNLIEDDPAAESIVKKDAVMAHKNGAKQKSFFVSEMKPQSSVFYKKRGATIENPTITTLDGNPVNMLVNSEAYIYTYSVYFERPAFNVRFGMLIKTVRGIEIGGHISAQPHKGIEYIDRFSRFRISFYWRCLLNPGAYFLNAGVLGIVNDNEIYLDRNIDVSMFRVQNNNNNNSTAIVNFVKSVEFEKI